MPDTETKPSVPPTKESLLEQFRVAAKAMSKKIEDAFSDITNLDITTMVGDQMTAEFDKITKETLNFKDITNATLVAYTRISLSGDIIEVLNGNPKDGTLKIDPKLLEIHRQNCGIGVESWNRFFMNMITVTATIWSLVDPNSDRAKVVEALREKIQPIGKPPDDK